MGFSHILTSFNGGEVDELIEGRPDYIKYNNACRKLENFRCLPTGAAENRPGSRLIAEAKFDDKQSILHSFQFSITTSFFLEFGDNYIRFFSNGGVVVAPAAPAWVTTTNYIIGDTVVESGNTYIALKNHTAGTFATDLGGGNWALIGVTGEPVEIATRFAAGSLFEIQKAQESDVVMMTDGIGRVQKLSRITDFYWVIEDFVFKTPPLLDPNITPITLEPSGTTGGITLTATEDLFQNGHIGSFWQINYPRTDNTLDVAINSSNLTTATIPVKGDWVFNTTGTWSATIAIQRSTDGINFTTIRTFTVASDRNIDTTGVEDSNNAVYRLKVTGHSSGTGSGIFVVFDFTVKGLVEITGFTDPQNVNATVVTTLGAQTPTADWSEGAFSDVRGYPRAITLHQSKLILAGTIEEPQTAWASRDDEFEDFELTSLDDGAIKFTPRTKRRANIQWMESQSVLIIGTTGGEMVVGFAREKITPSNIPISIETNYGSSDTVPGLLMHEVIMFVQRQGRKIRELTFNDNKQGLDAIDRTILSSQITEGGIKQLDFQKQPHGFLFGITGNGALVGMTYERDQDIWGWHRHVTDGFYESVATDVGPDEDEVWVIVKRTDGNGVTKKFVEQFAKRDFENQEDGFFVDSGLSFVAPPKFVITGATQADPIVITATGINVNDGEQILFDETIKGMDELLGNVFTVKNKTATTFELRDETDSNDVDGTGFVAYVSDGNARRVEKNFAGLDHLEAKKVAIACDGALAISKTVVNGEVELEEFCSVAHIGLPYVSTLIPMKLEIPTSFGTSQGKKKRISKIIVKLFKTLGLEVGQNEDNLSELPFRKDEDPTDTAPPLFTGDIQVSLKNNYNTGGDIILRQVCPLPCTVLGIVPIVETFGPT